MAEWAEAQRKFSLTLLDPQRGEPQELCRADASAGHRFDVYRNNRAVSLVEALMATFPVVLRLVGETYFAAAARAYIDEYPPTSPVLLLYGKSFGDFLERLPSARRYSYLGDVARLEWCRIRALHAADAEFLPIARLGEIPGDEVGEITFTFHPSLALISSRWPIASLWFSTLEPKKCGRVDMGGRETVLVIRPVWTVEIHTLDTGNARFLYRLSKGENLMTAAEKAAGADSDFDLSNALQQLFQIRAVVAVNLPTREGAL